MTRRKQVRAVFLAALMVLSVFAVGGAGLATAKVDSAATEPIEVVAVDGTPTDPVLNESNNNDVENLPRVLSGDVALNPDRSAVTVNISVTNNDPLNLTFTQASLSTGQNPYASGVDYGVGIAGTPGATQPGITVRDGGPLDANSTAPDGFVEIDLIVDADNAPVNGFANGENVSIAISDAAADGSYQAGVNTEILAPAVRVDEVGGLIGDPDDTGANSGAPPRVGFPTAVPGTDQSLGTGPGNPGAANYAPDLVDIFEEEDEDNTQPVPSSRTSVHQGEQVRVIAQVNETNGDLSDVYANVSDAATGISGNGLLTGVTEVQMYLDQNRDGMISDAEQDVSAIGPNGTYIGRFYVSPNAPPGSYTVSVNATDERGNENAENSTTISVVARNQGVPNVYAQEGDNRVTVVFPFDVYTRSPPEDELTRQDFAYIDNNNESADNGATGIVRVDHEPGSQVAVLYLDEELNERDLVTSAFPSRANNPQSDEIRIRPNEIFDDTGAPITGGPPSDQSIIESRTTFTYSVPKTKQGEFPQGYLSTAIDPQVNRDVNPEEEIYVLSGTATAQGQAPGINRPGPAVSFFVDDSSNTMTKNAVGNDLSVGNLPDFSQAQGSSGLFYLNRRGDLQTIIPPNYPLSFISGAVVTSVDLGELSPSGAADGDLNVTGQAAGQFRTDRQAVEYSSPAGPAFGINGSTDIAPVGTRNLVGPGGYGTASDATFLTTTTVDHTRPAIQTAVVQPSIVDNTVDIDFSEPVQNSDGNELNADDFEYIDNNGAGATEIVRVEDNTRGDEFVDLILNADVTASDARNDRIRVVPNQIVDADSFAVENPNPPRPTGEAVEIGNPARDGLGTNGVPLLNATVVPTPAVEVVPGTAAGDGSIVVEADSSIGLNQQGIVAVQLIDSQGNFLDPDKDGQPESIAVRDGGFAYVSEDNDGIISDGTLVGVDLDGVANGEVTVRLELDRIFDSGQAADGQATVYAQADDQLTPATATQNQPTSVYQNTLTIDSTRPTIASVNGAVGESQINVTFTEPTFATENSHEELRADDFRYIDRDFAGATEILEVEYPPGKQAGNPTVTLTLDRTLTSQDLIDDQISVDPDNIEDTVGNPLLVGSPTTGIGGPNVDNVTISATSLSGGSSTITVQAFDAKGNALKGVDITLSVNGQQRTTVTTTAQDNTYKATTTLSGLSDGDTVTAEANGESASTTLGDGSDGGNGDGPVFPGPIVPGGQAPSDTDGDGLYEDVNGDGAVDFDDAVDLAFVDPASLNQAQIAALDFDGDGDLDFDDAIELAFP